MSIKSVKTVNEKGITEKQFQEQVTQAQINMVEHPEEYNQILKGSRENARQQMVDNYINNITYDKTNVTMNFDEYYNPFYMNFFY